MTRRPVFGRAGTHLHANLRRNGARLHACQFPTNRPDAWQTVRKQRSVIENNLRNRQVIKVSTVVDDMEFPRLQFLGTRSIFSVYQLAT